jgi:hypothetical protein
MTTCPNCGLRQAASLQNIGCARHLGYADACEVRIRDMQIKTLQAQLATQSAEIASALRRAEAAEFECRAWRALAELQDGRYDVAFPGRRTLGDFGGSVGDRTKREPSEFGPSQVIRVYGEGATSGEAAIDLANKAGLLDAASPGATMSYPKLCDCGNGNGTPHQSGCAALTPVKP